MDKKLADISWEFENNEDSDLRLTEIYNFLLLDDKERIGIDRNDYTTKPRK